MVFIFPWATVFGSHEIIATDPRWGWFALAEMFVFLGILIIGLVYVWRKGDLNWIKPKPVIPTVNTHIPQSVYDNINLKQSRFTIKEFVLDAVAPNSTEPAATAATEAAPVRKPMFKPTFKKPANDA